MSTLESLNVVLDTHGFDTFFVDPLIWGHEGTRPHMSETLIKVVVVGSRDCTRLVALFGIERNNVEGDDGVHEEDYLIIHLHRGEDVVSRLSLNHGRHVYFINSRHLGVVKEYTRIFFNDSRDTTGWYRSTIQRPWVHSTKGTHQDFWKTHTLLLTGWVEFGRG